MNEVQLEMDDLMLVQRHVSLFAPSQYPLNKEIYSFDSKC